MPEALLILDASHLLRTYYHWSKGPKGEQPADGPDVVERFLQRLERLHDKLSGMLDIPAAYCIFDNPKETFRHWLTQTYKSGRERHEDWPEIKAHAMQAVEHCDTWGLEVAAYPFEADDLIASVAKQVRCNVIIHGADKDFNQCLEKGRVTILKSSNVNEDTHDLDMKWMTADSLEQEFGFGPDRWIEYQCMVGDSVDSIKGAEGIGDKGARQILKECADISGAMPKLGPKTEEKWVEFQMRLPRVKQLIKLNTKMDLPRSMRCFA